MTNVSQCTSLSYISWIILMTSNGNILNNVSFLVAYFFVLRPYPGNNSNICFFNLSFFLGALRLFQIVTGVLLKLFDWFISKISVCVMTWLGSEFEVLSGRFFLCVYVSRPYFSNNSNHCFIYFTFSLAAFCFFQIVMGVIF